MKYSICEKLLKRYQYLKKEAPLKRGAVHAHEKTKQFYWPLPPTLLCSS